MNKPKYYAEAFLDVTGFATDDIEIFDRVPGRAVYQLIGTFERVTQPAAPLPFEVGKVYKDVDGMTWFCVGHDRLTRMIVESEQGHLKRIYGDGLFIEGCRFLIPDKSPATTRVEFVPVTVDAGGGE